MNKVISQVQKDVLDRVETFTSRMIESSVELAKDSIDYSVGLLSLWRKLGLVA